MILTIVIGIIVLSVLVIAHELGHFITAKASGVWVKEFGLGYPPRLFGKKWGDTVYSINWIPFGGFNSLSGEVDPAEPRSLASRGIGTRLLVIGGGIIMNLLLPFVLLSVAFMVPHDVVVGEVVVQQVFPDSPAALAGIEAGDIYLRANDQPLNSYGDLARFIQIHLGDEVTLTVKHPDGTIADAVLTPRWLPPEGESITGTVSQTLNPTIVSESFPLWQAIPKGAVTCIESLALYKNGIIGLIIGTVPFVMTGPVGIVQVTGEVAREGISPVLELAAVISIALAVTQLIPFPALDGGRIFFILLEWARRGKRVPPKVEGVIHSIGFFVLLALMFVITYQDIIRIIAGESLIP